MSKKIFTLLCLVLIASMLLPGCGKKATTEPAIAPTNAPEKPVDTVKPVEPTKLPEPTLAPEPVYLTINTEQVSTWVRNFNPFSPDARGATGTAIYEITGAHHHHYFPIARAENLPPG